MSNREARRVAETLMGPTAVKMPRPTWSWMVGFFSKVRQQDTVDPLLGEIVVALIAAGSNAGEMQVGVERIKTIDVELSYAGWECVAEVLEERALDCASPHDGKSLLEQIRTDVLEEPPDV